MRRALLGVALLAPLCALLGVFVTARRLAFFSDTVAHASLAGIGVAFLLGLQEPTPGMLAVSLVVAAAIVWLREQSGLSNDTIMALLLTGSVATGTVILSRLHRFGGDLHQVLFGDILGIGSMELWLAAGLLAFVVIAARWALSPLSLIAANEELAHVSGLPVRWFNYGFVVLLTLTVTVTIRLVGILLVGALLIIPAASARMLSRNLRQEIILAVVMGLVAGVSGVLASGWVEDLPCGSAVVLASLLLFLGSLGIRRFIQRGRRPQPEIR